MTSTLDREDSMETELKKELIEEKSKLDTHDAAVKDNSAKTRHWKKEVCLMFVGPHNNTSPSPFAGDASVSCLLHHVLMMFVIPRTYPQSSRRSGTSSCWTMAVEQLSVQPTTIWPYPSSVPPGVENVFVWLTETTARRVLLFVVWFTNVLTYLPTYLHTSRVLYLFKIEFLQNAYCLPK